LVKCNLIIDEDEYVKNKTWGRGVAESNRSSEILSKQIALANVADIKTVLFKLT